MILIERARREHLPRLVELIREFAVFEKLGDICKIDEDGLASAIFRDGSQVRCLLAFSETACVGYALFYPVFKTFSGVPSMYLEDLFVIPECRGEGVGSLLMKAVAKEAQEAGISRLDWQVLKWNEAAMEFYRALGSEQDDGNVDFRISGEAFQNLLE